MMALLFGDWKMPTPSPTGRKRSTYPSVVVSAFSELTATVVSLSFAKLGINLLEIDCGAESPDQSIIHWP